MGNSISRTWEVKSVGAALISAVVEPDEVRRSRVQRTLKDVFGVASRVDKFVVFVSPGDMGGARFLY
jgi:hypothetical protein